MGEALREGLELTENLQLTGLDCADCAAKIEKAVSKMEGVTRAAVNFAASKMKVVYDPAKLHRGDIVARIEKMGYGVATSVSRASSEVREDFELTGLDCADCATKIATVVGKLEGVASAEVNFGASKMKVAYNPARLDQGAIVSRIEKMGYGAVPLSAVRAPEATGITAVGTGAEPQAGARVAQPQTTGTLAAKARELPFWIKHRKAFTTAVSGVFLGVGVVLGWLRVPEVVTVPFYVAAMVTGGYYPARAGFYAVRNGLGFDMNFLMTIAAIGAAAIGEWAEGATVVFLFSLGNALEGYAMEKTRQSIRSLMDLAPNEALVRRGGQEVRLQVEQIVVGDVIIVKPGERIAMDGRVIGGRSSVNQAPITGESIPVQKALGDEVFAGTINEKGSLEVQVTRLVRDNTLSRIIALVEEAQAQKAPSQRFVDLFAKYYTPIVILLAAGIAVIPPLFGAPFSPWFYRALTLLVVSCPCALVISTPVSIVSAIGNAARNGVLIKGGAHLEQAGGISAVAFDKTGTLTVGKPEVTDVIPIGGTPVEEVIRVAAGVESRSEHPLADAILQKAKNDGIQYETGENFVSITGKGAKARVGDRTHYVGSPRLFAEDLGLDASEVGDRLRELQSQGKTAVLVGNKERVLGIIAVADTVRDTSRQAVTGLKEAGVRRIIMLTGDNEGTAAAIARQLGIDEYRAQLLPQDKLAAIKELQAKYGPVAMVGDGVNDAPALATATVGIAMGGAGTDTALETADIALMADDPAKLPFTIRLSRRALGIIKQNITFSLVVKLVAVALVFPGWLNLWLAILADTGASLIVIGNGMRLLKVRP